MINYKYTVPGSDIVREGRALNITVRYTSGDTVLVISEFENVCFDLVLGLDTDHFFCDGFEVTG